MEAGVKSAYKLHSGKCYTFAFKLACSQVEEKTMTSYAIYNMHKNNKTISIIH